MYRKLLVIFIILLVISRFVNIGIVPVFVDEAINLQWAGNIGENIKNIIVPIYGSQLPIYMIFLAIIDKATFFVLNPLYNARILSVVLDLITALIVLLIGQALFNRKYGLICILIYLSFPFTFFHSRIGILDSMTNSFVITTVYLFILLLLSKKSSLILEICIIFFMNLAFFTKPIALLSFLPLIMFPYFFSKRFPIKANVKFHYYRTFILGCFIILVLFLPIFNFIIVHVNNIQFSMGTLKTLTINIRKSLIWFDIYFSSPILIAGLILMTLSVVKKNWINIWLSLWFLSVILFNSLLGKNYYPRHLYPMVVPLTFILGWGVQKYFLRTRIISISLFFILFVPLYIHDYNLLIHPDNVLAGEDYQQFYGDWTSGIGFKETADKLTQLSMGKSIDVYVDDIDFTGWSLSKLFRIGKTNLYSLKNGFSDNILKDNSYILLNYQEIPDQLKNSKPIFSYLKSPGHAIRLYRL